MGTRQPASAATSVARVMEPMAVIHTALCGRCALKYPFVLEKRTRVSLWDSLMFGRLAFGFANVRVGTRVLTPANRRPPRAAEMADCVEAKAQAATRGCTKPESSPRESFLIRMPLGMDCEVLGSGEAPRAVFVFVLCIRPRPRPGL